MWTINLLYGRPLFIDEANVARNLYDRGYAALFAPLDHDQYAPPLYLMAGKFLGDVFGYAEIPLRIPAFLGGLLAVYGLYKSGRYLDLGPWVLLPLAFLFVNPTVLRYVGEIKPYGLDLGIAALLIALRLRPRQRKEVWRWTVIGTIAPWLSLPSVFVLAAVGLLRLRTDWRYSLAIGAWLLSFAGLYFTVLRPSVGSGYLNSFHAEYFFPLATSWEELLQTGRIIFRMLRLSYGFTVVALVWGGALLVTGMLRLPTRRLWLLLPLLVAMGASTLRLYSLIDRLLLFALPGVWLFTALSARSVYASLGKARPVALLLTVAVLGGTNIYRSFYEPVRFSDGRKLAEIARTAGAYTLHPDAVPVVEYYRRIHPQTSKEWVKKVGSGADHVLIYDVTTRESTRQTIRRDSIGAAERGCNVLAEKLYRSGVLRLRCPVPNSDP
ncbi:hypothetical protein GGR28_000818 [Lewinella aquimaris]|uniref:Glycosyltransferase RgtA/B/C/D-like domain-containing protein n=1 Tax=Neolewinella aquimaris TaxID=1835722 RepID=A0A840E505_9BACT|nr:hypothetical protein [Neolewinella aquimaris]